MEKHLIMLKDNLLFEIIVCNYLLTYKIKRDLINFFPYNYFSLKNNKQLLKFSKKFCKE